MVNAVDVGCETPGVFGVLGEMEAVGRREKIKTNTQKRCQRNNHAPKKQTMFKSTVPVVINGLKGLNVLKPWRFLLAAQNTYSHPGSSPDKLTYLGSNATMEIQMLEDNQ